MERNRYIDFLRAAAILMVVIGHWLVAAPYVDSDGVLTAGHLLADLPWTRWLTWLFQVMPVFFLVGGYANAASWHSAHPGPYGHWLQRRVIRLLRPVAPLMVFWSALVIVLDGCVRSLAGRFGDPGRPGAGLVPGHLSVGGGGHAVDGEPVEEVGLVVGGGGDRGGRHGRPAAPRRRLLAQLRVRVGHRPSTGLRMAGGPPPPGGPLTGGPGSSRPGRSRGNGLVSGEHGRGSGRRGQQHGPAPPRAAPPGIRPDGPPVTPGGRRTTGTPPDGTVDGDDLGEPADHVDLPVAPDRHGAHHRCRPRPRRAGPGPVPRIGRLVVVSTLFGSWSWPSQPPRSSLSSPGSSDLTARRPDRHGSACWAPSPPARGWAGSHTGD
ncbi:MAG: hypothetical protein KatS3mg011_2061 [Acidimicrobiia bacterium]|nr:MAG: hypothetical protein KatS3mg011_2061 [Acidimicrobiia bacterium]